VEEGLGKIDWEWDWDRGRMERRRSGRSGSATRCIGRQWRGR